MRSPSSDSFTSESSSAPDFERETEFSTHSKLAFSYLGNPQSVVELYKNKNLGMGPTFVLSETITVALEKG